MSIENHDFVFCDTCGEYQHYNTKECKVIDSRLSKSYCWSVLRHNPPDKNKDVFHLCPLCVKRLEKVFHYLEIYFSFQVASEDGQSFGRFRVGLPEGVQPDPMYYKYILRKVDEESA